MKTFIWHLADLMKIEPALSPETTQTIINKLTLENYHNTSKATQQKKLETL